MTNLEGGPSDCASSTAAGCRWRSCSATRRTGATAGRCGTPGTVRGSVRRFLLILALAYLLLAGLGLQAKLDYEPSQWCTNTRDSECSVITIGKAMLGRCNYDPEELLRRVRYATEQVAARWG